MWDAEYTYSPAKRVSPPRLTQSAAGAGVGGRTWKSAELGGNGHNSLPHPAKPHGGNEPHF